MGFNPQAKQMTIDRRIFLKLAATATAAASLPRAGVAQQVDPAIRGPQARPPFGYEDVIRRARDLSSLPYERPTSTVEDMLAKLDFDAYRDIRFRPDKALFAQSGSPFRMQLFHPGFLFRQPVTINVIREGVPTPVPFSAQMFDYGRTKLDKPLPVNTGFAGFRLHYPLNKPQVFDEAISFLGASYFRFLGRGQHYGLSARGLAINAGGDPEEFPVFREFWIETPAPDAERATIYALLDSPSITGAFQFHLYPASQSVLDVTATLFPRTSIPKLGIAPLTSMFFSGENDRHSDSGYRPELHDSDGLLIHSGSGEWIWRPLRNSQRPSISAFVENNPRGFGLMQRDRQFSHYQDLDLHYQTRPSYWIEPHGNWGEGHVELVELPTGDETNDNIVASWIPRQTPERGQELTYGYRITALDRETEMHPGGKVLNTFVTLPKAHGSDEPVPAGARRYLVDFNGDDLPYYLSDPQLVQVDASVSAGQVTRAFVLPNPAIGGFRASIDIEVPEGQTGDVRAFLRAGGKALTETWIYPWSSQ